MLQWYMLNSGGAWLSWLDPPLLLTSRISAVVVDQVNKGGLTSKFCNVADGQLSRGGVPVR
jgi:hypothetical protein